MSHDRPAMRLLLAGLLLAIALYVRLLGITQTELQTDEFHWLDRSHKIVDLFHNGRYRVLTSHLGQPGIPAALGMAVAEQMAVAYNEKHNFHFGDSGYVDRLTAARLSNAVISSLLIPAMFLMGVGLIGLFPAGLASVLFALSPNYIALSQIAHLDSQVTFYATLSILTLAHAVRKKSASLKVLSGVFWGLTIATKPTGAVLVPIFILYKLIRPLFSKFGSVGERSIVWSDVWAVIAGQTTFILLYTRMWEAESQYRFRLQMSNPVADALYKFAQHSFAARFLLFCVLIGALIAQCLYFSRRRRAKETAPWFSAACRNLLAIAAILIAVVVLFPHVAENILLFWCWVAGLRGMHHVAYGLVWEAPKYGYWGLFLTRAPSIIIVGGALAFLFYLCRMSRIRGAEASEVERLSILTLLVMCVIIWPLPLSLSTKQALRYAMPIFPALYLFTAEGCLAIVAWIAEKLNNGKKILAMQVGLMACMAGIQVRSAAKFCPFYNLYFNGLSGGLHGAVERKEIIPAVGLRQTITYLHERAVEQGTPFNIDIIGDISTLRYLNKVLYPASADLVKFHSVHSPSVADYFLAIGVFHSDLPNYMGAEMEHVETLYTFSFQGEELTSVVKIPQFELKVPFSFDLMLSPSQTGRRPRFSGTKEDDKDGTRAIEVSPDRHSKGYMMFGERVRLPRGKYVGRFYLGIPKDTLLDPALTPDRFAVRVDVSKACNRTVLLGELSQDEVRGFEVPCELPEDDMLSFRVYWFGNVPTILSAIELERAKE